MTVDFMALRAIISCDYSAANLLICEIQKEVMGATSL